jgi:hypothetical protein
MNPLHPYRYRRTGTSTYEVSLDGTVLGSLWRTRDGWRYRTTDERTGEVFGVSRDVAAAALRRTATQAADDAAWEAAAPKRSDAENVDRPRTIPAPTEDEAVAEPEPGADVFLAEAVRQEVAAAAKLDRWAGLDANTPESRALHAEATMHENAAAFLREAHAIEQAKPAIARVKAFAERWPIHTPHNGDDIYGLTWMEGPDDDRQERSVTLTVADLLTVVEFAWKAVTR